MPPPTKIIAHRGASCDAPENTVAAAKLAWEQGADLVEIDIHLTKDKKIVAIHDASTRRTTGIQGIVAEMTLTELRKLDAGSYKHRKYSGEKIPTLEEMIATMPHGRGLMIEIKNGPEIIPVLKEILSASGIPLRQFSLISFDDLAVKTAKEALPECRALWIIQQAPKGFRIADLIRHCREAGLDGLDLHYHWPIAKALVQQVKDHDLLLYTWTVDDARIALRHIEAGVDGITTNRPGWLREKWEGSR